MNTDTENKLIVKLFVGFEITSELRMHLNDSLSWKEACLIPDKNVEDLAEVTIQDCSHIGLYLEYKMLTIKDIKSTAKKGREKLFNYCPKFNNEKLKTVIFPQVFVT